MGRARGWQPRAGGSDSPLRYSFAVSFWIRASQKRQPTMLKPTTTMVLRLSPAPVSARISLGTAVLTAASASKSGGSP